MGLILGSDYTIDNEKLAFLFALLVKHVDLYANSLEEFKKVEKFIINYLNEDIEDYFYNEETIQTYHKSISDAEDFYSSYVDEHGEIDEDEIVRINYNNVIESKEPVIYDFDFFTVTYKKICFNDTIHIIISPKIINEKNSIEEILGHYINLYKEGFVHNPDENILSDEGEKEAFLNCLTEKKYNLKNFHVRDTENIYAIIQAFVNKEITVEFIECKVTFEDKENYTVQFHAIINAENFVMSHFSPNNKKKVPISKNFKSVSNRQYRTLKLFLEFAIRKLNKDEFYISYTELNEIRVYPNKKNIASMDNLSRRVSNRISKIRPLFKELSNTNNNLFEVNPDMDYKYEIIASEEQMEMVLERISEILG